MIEMGMHGGHRQLMVIMLQASQPLGQFALMVVIDVGEIGDAMPSRRIALAVTLDGTAKQIAHGFGTIAVAPSSNQLIELAGQRFIE